MRTNLKSLAMSILLVGFPISNVFAEDGDSSSDLAAGFAAQVQQSHGVIVKVQVNEQGQEFTDTAELRVVTTQEQPTTGEQAQQIFQQNAVQAPRVAVDSATGGDSSTWGRRWAYTGWNSWGYYGWQPAGYYYNYYTPTWTYGYSYYNYYRPAYSYNPYYNGYRYYYYPRYW